MNSTNDNMLRKAAILITSLDESSAEALLASMPLEQKKKLLRAASQLDHVDPEERRQIVEEFKNKSATPKAPASSAGVELDPSLAIKMNTGYADQGMPPQKTSPSPPTPFSFLRDASPDQIVMHLRSEHPQTVAVVISYLLPDQAAAVLQRMPESLQADVMQRLIDLDDADPTMVSEIESQLEGVLAEKSRRDQKKEAGLKSMQAILDASGEESEEMLEALSRRNPTLLARLGYRTASPTLAALDPSPVPPPSTLQTPSVSTAINSDEDSATDEIVSSLNADPSLEEIKNRFHSFDDLASLSTADWAEVISQADPSVVLLGLAAAPKAIVDRIICGLAPQEGRQWRSELANPGPLWLPDIEAAQKRLVEIAQQLAARGMIGQHFASISS